MPNKTPLNELHRAAGARMVDFGGWDMPLHYGSQLEEHHAVRRDAGMFDVSHMRVVDLHGTATRDFLRYALANNVDKLATPGKALYSCLLRHDGGVLDDLIAYFMRDDWFRLVVNAATASKDVAWLADLAASRRDAPRIEPRADLAMIAVQGPNARVKTWSAFAGSESVTSQLAHFHAAEVGELFVGRTGYTGEDGFEIVVPAARVVDAWRALETAGVALCGLGARDTLRLEAGMNLYGQDMDEAVNPLESGLGWTVDLKSPRDFVGKSALEGASPSRMQVGLVLEGTGGVLRAHQRVHTSHGAGETTSGSFAPTLARSIALGRVPLGAKVGDSVEVEIRDKRLRASIVKPPFVRHGKPLV